MSFGRSLIIGKAIRIIGLSRLFAVLLIGCLTLPLPAARADGQDDRQNLPGNESERPQGLVKPGRIDENESDVESGKIGKIGKITFIIAPLNTLWNVVDAMKQQGPISFSLLMGFLLL